MPERKPLPSDVESFISYCIDSVEQVEVLLLLSATRDRQWTIDELSTHLRSSSHAVSLRLASLVAHRLVARVGVSFAYAASPGDDALVQRLAALYAERRTAVIERIFIEPKDPMRSFADAFRLRDEHEGEPDG
jgi:hypothetical protein